MAEKYMTQAFEAFSQSTASSERYGYGSDRLYWKTEAENFSSAIPHAISD